LRYEGHIVEKFRSLEHLKAQVTVIRWHLDAAALEHDGKKRRHLDGASLTYQGAVELLAQLALPDEERAVITKQLAELRERLRAAGQQV
jgi:hypothetical protein